MRRIGIAVGLALLYASAYFLPLLNPYSLYFIPDFYEYVVRPSLVAVLVVAPVLVFGASSWVRPRWRQGTLFFAAVVLTFIAAKGLLDAAGLPWTSVLALIGKYPAIDQLEGSRWLRMAVVCLALPAAALMVYRLRRQSTKLLRFLSTLGYAFVFLAIYRCLSGDLDIHHAEQNVAHLPSSQLRPAARRVVWVIFDEMDYRESMVANIGILPNFASLSARSVISTNAFTPGRDTLYSIPSLLMGIPVKGIGVSRGESLNLTALDGQKIPFDTAHSIFSRLPGGVQSASVLGFYHPYCRIFPALHSCHSAYLGNAGRWFDSLLFFSDAAASVARFMKWPILHLPASLLRTFDPMYRVSSESIEQLVPTLADKSSALNFIHVNMPHLPNVYAQRALGYAAANDRDAYAQNLRIADALLGKIVSALATPEQNQTTLLIVSSDHWLRTASSGAAPVPFIAWLVGAGTEQSHTLHAPFSTVHTTDMAVDFLNGRVDSQAAIAASLESSRFSPTWLPPDGYRYY